MKHPWFNLRLLIVGGILLLPYVPALWIAHDMGLPLAYGFGGLGICLLAQYWVGMRRALRSVDATQLPDDSTPVRRLRTLADELDVAPPKLSVGRFGSPNAFAVGRRGNGHIVLSESLIALLDEDELDAVLAHELSHLRSRDTIPMIIGQGSAGIVFGIISALESLLPHSDTRDSRRVNTPVSDAAHGVVMCLVFAISRQREYVADADAAEVLESPTPIRSALQKLNRAYAHQDFPEPPEAVETLCIASDWSFANVFSSHPSLADRIDALADTPQAEPEQVSEQ